MKFMIFNHAFIITVDLYYSLVCREGCQQFVTELYPNYAIPSKSNIGHSLFPELYGNFIQRKQIIFQHL